MDECILVIDDEESIRDSFRLALEGTGYDIDTASTGEEGLMKAASRRPDLIFLDLRMPGIGGVETLRRLQSVCPGTPVYVVTAFYQAYFEPLKQIQSEGIPFQLARKPLTGSAIREITRSVLAGPEAVHHD